MSDLYSNDSGSKKKFLAPVLVMLLCMVSLSGAAFAYSATVDNLSPVDVEGITMSLKANGGDEVTGAIYSMDDVDIATHTTNGKAIWWSQQKAFDAAGGHAYNDTNPSSIANSAAGYYVEVIKGVTSVGYQNNAGYANKADFETALNAGTNGLYQLGSVNGGHDLAVVNESGAAIKVTATFTYTADCCIHAIYVLYKVGAGEVQFQKITSGSSFDIVASIDDGANETVNIKAYVALSDYYSATLPDLADDPSIDVEFATAAAA